MTNKTPEVSQGDGGTSLPYSQPGPPEHQRSHGSNGNTIFKNGPLYISSKGIGWTSWKKRWFVLTCTSLVFFRSDPNIIPQKGGEVNLTLGGIDLNNSGSVVVKADKKLLTVLFPDGRAFTLKADTVEDLHEWKTALENALALAPGASDVTDKNAKNVEPPKSTVVGLPILLALEEDDGAPSFLEKALRFIEDHGVKVEGILRQAASVNDVECRVREYEQGKTEFSADEDPHVVADCLKYVLRELLSSPVPASCCKALLEACHWFMNQRNDQGRFISSLAYLLETERAGRISAVRAAICETFPEPNRRLLQRILQMMQTVASHKTVNRMSSPAVAACMAPLLLRPLLAGECNIENDFDVGGDGSVQLLQAAAAANHAQIIVMTLLEEYDGIFGEEGSGSPGIYSDSEESGSGSEEGTEDDESYDDDDDECDEESIQESDADADAEGSEIEDSGGEDDKNRDLSRSDLKPSGDKEDPKVNQISSRPMEVSLSQDVDIKSCENMTSSARTARAEKSSTPTNIVEVVSTDQSTVHNSSCSIDNKSTDISDDPAHASSHTILGRTSAMKSHATETTDSSTNAAEMENLEAIKVELQNKITEESNANLQSYLEKQKKFMHERRLALAQDVARLREQLQKEKNYWATLEAGNKYSPGSTSNSTSDEKIKADLEEIALIEADLTKLWQRIDDVGRRFNVQHEHTSNHETTLKNKLDTEDAVTSQSQIERSKRKDVQFGGTESEDEKKSVPTSLLNKYAPQATPKKVGAKVEVSNFTTSRLTKLSTRLNFLKERRNQIQQSQPPLNNKPRGSEAHSVSNPEKGRAMDSSQPPSIADKSSGKEPESLQNSDKMRKSDGQSTFHPDKWKEEGHQSYNVDKGR